MKISILIPIYNVEKYLRHCLNSVLNQKDIKDVDLDIVLVDDGSTDSSLDIAIEYAKKDERIFVLSKANAGASTARNAAFELIKGTKLRELLEKNIQDENVFVKSYKNARSFDKTDIKKLSKEDIDKNFIKLHERVYKAELKEINEFIVQDLPDDVYVHFLDSDDYLDERCISTCKRYIQEKDLSLYLHNLSSVDEDSNIIKENIYIDVSKKPGFYQSGLDFLKQNNLYDFYFSCQGMFKAALLNSYKLRFASYMHYEDHDFAIILFSLSGKFFVDDRALLYYRSRSGSSMNSTKELEFPKTMPFYLENLRDYFKTYKELRLYYKIYSFCVAAGYIFKFYRQSVEIDKSFAKHKAFFDKCVLNLIKIFKISLKNDPLNIKKMLKSFSFDKKTIIFFFLKDIHRQPKKLRYIKNLRYLLKDKK